MTSTIAAPDGWPLSAAATTMLREPGLHPGAVLKLALRELVVRGVLRVGEVERRRYRSPRVSLLPGVRPATGLPVPLSRLADTLLPHMTATGTDAIDAVQDALDGRRDLLVQLHTEVREELGARGLIASERYRVLGVIPRTRWVRTPAGEAWVAVPHDLEVNRTAAGAALPAVGLLLALDEEVIRALRGHGGDGPVVVTGAGDTGSDRHIDDATLDAVLGDVGAGLDGAVDAGAGGGGSDGGDGGGGGGGGGD